jgi:replication initiation protein RepC
MQTASTGGRRLTRAVLAAREHRVENERGVARKELSKAAREAEQALELRPTLRIVLKELVGCWGEKEIAGRLMVWPSTDYLIARTGLSERAIRNALRGLTELEIVAPRDSANGKRFAIKNADGEIIDAFGFDLAPLFNRSAEFVALNDAHRRRRERQERLFDAITIARRATQEALLSLSAHYPDVKSDDVSDALEALMKRTPRRGSQASIDTLVDEWQSLRDLVERRYYDAGNAGTKCRHIETDNGSSSGSCNKGLHEEAEPVRKTEQPVTIGLLLETCPAYRDFGLEIRNVSDLVVAGRQLRGTIGAHESAWLEATESIGAVRAAAAVIYVLQLHTDDVASGDQRIKNPGGYFRALVRMIADRRFNLETELHALRRRKMS